MANKTEELLDDKFKTGWVKLYRSVQKNWLWEKPLSKLEAWIDIIMSANIVEEKVRFGNDLYVCGRGEKLYSYDTWAERWGWNKSKVRRFLKMLESDTMIELKPNHYTTHLSICNYNLYQDIRNGSETQLKRKRNGSETEVTPTKEYKNVKNDKEVLLFPEEKHKLITWMEKHTPRVLQIKDGLTYEQCENIAQKYPAELVRDILLEMQNFKPLLRKYTSANLTIQNWLKRRQDEKFSGKSGQQPKGTLNRELYESELNSVRSTDKEE